MSIQLIDVSYIYGSDTPMPVRALDHINLEIPKGQFIGIIGHTGSGKSTLIQMLNGLLKPGSGQVLFDSRDIWSDGYPIRELRFKAGLVFQYPEHQLFEENVLKDICFGPKNKGLSDEDALKAARDAMALVNLPEKYEKYSPFELSGGEKRRVAIAGVLAMDPDFLILDEPTAGLDPEGRDEILSEIARLQKAKGMTVILVSHSMEDVAVYAGRLIVMDAGQIRFDASPREVFTHRSSLEAMGLSVPQITDLADKLGQKGFYIPKDIITVQEAKEAILKELKKRGRLS